MRTITPRMYERLQVFAPLVLTAGPAWILLALGSGGFAVPAFCTSTLLWSVPTAAVYDFFFVYVSPVDLVLSWAVMVCAMMLPTLADTIGQVRARSFPSDRLRLSSLVISGYFSVWMLSGALFLTLALTLRLGIPSGGSFVLSCTLTFLWHISPWKQHVLNRCHRQQILPAFAPAADREAFRLGLTKGASCLASCWALMLTALLASSHHFIIMALVAAFIWAERIEPARTPAWQLRTPQRTVRLVSHLLKRLA